MLERGMKWMALPALVTVAVGLQLSDAPGLLGREPTPVDPTTALFVDDVDWRGPLRGNVHVHTRMSDGDSSPARVVDWYRDNGYDFVAITDHNRRYQAARRQPTEDAAGDIVVLPGEEVTMAAHGKPVHVNALCTRRTIGSARFERQADAVRWAVDRIHEQGGVALVNHPNFLWALAPVDIAAAPGAQLLDVFNGHPDVRSDGDGERPSVEVLWQTLLDHGSVLAPAAVDDAHAFTPLPPAGVPHARPGTGWVGVFADARDPRSICDALDAGRLYASSGPTLSRIVVDGDLFAIWIREPEAEISFIGAGGEVLALERPAPADQDGGFVRYRLTGGERMVRARIDSPRGQAWTGAFRTVEPAR